MRISWRIFTDCASDAAAIRVISAHFKGIDLVPANVSVLPYHKGGYIATADTEHSSVDWPTFVFEALSFAQRAADGWVLQGDIAEALDAWSNSAKTVGVSAVHIQALAMS